jgi:hypothetical protein
VLEPNPKENVTTDAADEPGDEATEEGVKAEPDEGASIHEGESAATDGESGGDRRVLSWGHINRKGQGI